MEATQTKNPQDDSPITVESIMAILKRTSKQQKKFMLRGKKHG